MLNRIHCSSKVLSASLALAVAAAIVMPMGGQEVPAVSVGNAHVKGVPDDWSHHHVVFANPGTEDQAIAKGTHEQWTRVVNDPRYVVQQLKKSHQTHGSAGEDVDVRIRLAAESALVNAANLEKNKKSSSKKADLKKDWSMALTASTTATGAMAANAFPATFSYSTTADSCAHDYAVFPTGLAGGATQATILGFTNLYSGCTTNPVPSNAFAYNTGGTASQSPVISLDGGEIAYVQTTSSVASLVLLKPSLGSGGTVGSPANDLVSVTAAKFQTCNAPCYTTLPFKNGANSTNSSPYYAYYGGPQGDTIFVGDDTGYLHKFTTVFYGTPTETVSATAPVWPAKASSETTPELTSPVYDSTSGLVFVGDATGWLHAVSASAGTVFTSADQNDCSTNGFVDGPVVDSTNDYIYVFVGYSCGGTTHTGYVNRYSVTSPTNPFSGQTYGTGVALNTSASTSDSLHAGAFDDAYFETSGAAGNLYVCSFGSLLRIPAALTAFTTYDTPVSAATTSCSPVTEVLGAAINTTLSTTMGTSGNASRSITVPSGVTLTTGDYLLVDSELMLVGAANGTDTWSVTRKELGTTETTHTAGVAVQEINGDWVFMSVPTNAKTAGSCVAGGGCLYNYNVIANATTGTATADQSATGGTSGISIDNTFTGTGDSQIYYTTLGNAACAGNTATPKVGVGTNGCAVQALQSAP